MDTDITPLLGISLGEYRLEQIIEQHALGPLFQARHGRTGTPFLLRLLIVDQDLSSRPQMQSPHQFQQLVAHLETLRHPYILPILDAGQFQGLSFLVYPNASTRTFSSRIRQSGPFDLAAAGRYLDQLAAVLEYANEHGIGHGALSLDSMFLQLDSRMLVADFGVQHILTNTEPESYTRLALLLGDSAAPEQLLGHPARISTDVYAMGVVLYRLLTGYPLYSGRSPDEVARQILNAPIPSLRQWRPDLPAELDALLALALAKDPAQRFHRPGMLANAYNQIVAPRNASRIPFAEEDVQPQMAQAAIRQNGDAQRGIGLTSPAYPQNSLPALLTPPPPPAELLQPGLPYPLPRRIGSPWRVIIGVALAFLIVIGGVFFITSQSKGKSQATGSVHFFDQQGGNSTGLAITASGLPALPTGSHYQAWLINNTNEQILPLGSLVAHSQTYTLQYFGFSGAAVNLLGAGNQVEITQEHGQAQAPLGSVTLMGVFPPNAFVHIRHLLVSYPTTPGQIGLLVGTLEQIQLLDTQAHQLQSTSNLNSIAARCLILSMLSIVEGPQGAHAQSLSAQCRQEGAAGGDGFGLLVSASSPESGYLSEASAHATLARVQPDATTAIRSHAESVIIALSNVTGWVTTIDTDLVSLLKKPTDAATVAEIVTLADNAYYGAGNTTQSTTPSNASPATGGALFAYDQGQLMADLPLVP